MPSPAIGGPPPEAIDAMEREMAELAKKYVPRKQLEIVDIAVAGSEVTIPVKTYRPVGWQSAAPSACVIWFHGGAFAFGHPMMNEGNIVAQELAGLTDALVLNVDYRLVTDDVKFPCAQVDALDVARWAIANANELHINTDRMFTGGGSAGACLAGSLSLCMRDRGMKLAGVLPVYPIAHMFLPEFSQELIELTAGTMQFDHKFAELHNPWLLGDNLALSAQYHAFPGDAADKSGQAPFLNIHAEKDTLRSSGQLWTQQLRAAGVAVDEFIEKGTSHGYVNMTPEVSQEMKHTMELMGRWINAH
jgi:acetyl esterase/lipase